MRKETESVLDEIGIERYRQVYEEGWTDDHDDEHKGGEMAMAAACYAFHAANGSIRALRTGVPLSWPWSADWWKPKTKRQDLVRAGALIVAEIERLDRVHDEQ